MITLDDVFSRHFEGIAIDKRLADAVYRYHVAFLNRDREHLAFFGSNLIGVHSIRFRVADTLKFYNDVLDIDYHRLEKDIRTVTTIVHEYKISSDPLNLTLMYLIHRFLTSPKLSETQRKRAAYDTALVFFYRCIAIRQSDYFHFPADPKVAQAAYAELSSKFLIKKVGTWKGVMEYRAKELLDPSTSIHLKGLISFTDDGAVTYAISDSENRIKDMYKNYCKVFHKSYSEGNRFQSTAGTQIDVDGVEQLKEKVKSTEQYVAYMRNVVLDKNSFVKPELIKIITEINSNTSQRIVTSSLSWLSDKCSDPKWNKKIDEWVTSVVVQSFYFVRESDLRDSRDLAHLLTQLKNLYLSTRSTDPDLLAIRKLGDELIKAANGSVNKSLAMATRTAMILYITLRALAMNSSR